MTVASHFINNEYIEEAVSKLAITNPFDGSTIGFVPLATKELVDQAVESSHKAFLKWRPFNSNLAPRQLNTEFNISSNIIN